MYNRRDGFINIKPKYNLAFYTCFYGTKTNPAFKIPEVPSEKYDCYYFTNNKEIYQQLKNTKWKPIFDNKPATEDIIESCMYGKYVKVMPHETELIKNYDYTCFLDSKLKKVSESFVEECIDKYFIQGDKALLLRKHEFLTDGSVIAEFNESMKQERYVKQKEQIMNYINKQIENGFNEKIPVHSQTGLLIRNMKHPKINEINSRWYSDIQKCGIQCQISFFFVRQEFDDNIVSFSENPFV
jgi:hypothetical protein